MQVTITELNRYPVKSCRGNRLQEAVLDRYGIEYDRRWLVTDPAHRFLTQRQVPAMATIGAEVLDGALALSAPGSAVLWVPLETRGAPVTVRVWRDDCAGEDLGDEPAAWLSDRIGVPCRLVRMGEAFVRQVDTRYAAPGDEVGFADGFPLLLTTEESLDELNAHLAEPVPMARFRPNVVVRGSGRPFAEDDWGELVLARAGDVLRVAKPCARCQIVCTDQVTGQRTGAEPLATLARFHPRGAGVLFGQNLVHGWRGEPMVLRVGDVLHVQPRPG